MCIIFFECKVFIMLENSFLEIIIGGNDLMVKKNGKFLYT